MFYKNSNINNINIINTFINPDNYNDFIIFKEVINNNISTNRYYKPYLWNENIEIIIDSNKDIKNITIYTKHHYSHSLGITGTQEMDPIYLTLSDNKFILVNEKIGSENEYCKLVDLEYECKYIDSDTKEELFSYKINYNIDDIENII